MVVRCAGVEQAGGREGSGYCAAEGEHGAASHASQGGRGCWAVQGSRRTQGPGQLHRGCPSTLLISTQLGDLGNSTPSILTLLGDCDNQVLTQASVTSVYRLQPSGIILTPST